MADKGPDDSPSLEMPSFSRWRRPPDEKDAEKGAEERAEKAPSAPRTKPPKREPRFPRPHRPKVRRPTVRLPGLPAVSGITAAVVVGALVGALAVLLTWLALTGCSAVRGTASCGGGPGLALLLAVLILLAWLGGTLLSRAGVPDAGSTSYLAVGVMAVLVMVFLMDALYDWWMVIAIPLVAVASYAFSWWVTTRVVQQEHEVR